MSEEWRAIPGYEGYFEVSTLGRVRSLDRTVERKNGIVQKVSEKLLSTDKRTDKGYICVSLRKDGKRRTVNVHDAMAAAFLGPRPEKHYVRHWDDDRDNNTLANLRYGLPGDNSRDAVRNGKNQNANKTHCKYGHEFVPANTRTTPSRMCNACNRARAQVSNGFISEEEYQRYADDAYQRIIEGGADRRYRTSAGYSRGTK